MPYSATTPPNDATPALSSGLPALDATTAIELMDNSTELYREIALAYLQEIADLAPRVAALLRQANPTEATRTLHTYKGLSLTVGANQLSDVCRQCELQLKTLHQDSLALDDATCARMQAALGDAIAQTQAALVAVLARLDDPALGEHAMHATAPDHQALAADLQALRRLLEKSDLQALDQYAALQVRHPFAQGSLQALSGAIKVFDFSQAVVQCEKLIRHFSDAN